MIVDRMGMRFSLILGGCSGALSTTAYWAVARQFFPIHHVVAILSILAVLICLSCGLIIGSIFKLTLLCGGAESKGSAVGVAKGFVGLGAGVYAIIYQALRTAEESALNFILVLAFFFLVCAVIPAWLLLPHKRLMTPMRIKIETQPLHFHMLYVSIFVLASVIVGTSIHAIMLENDDNSETGMSSKHSRNWAKVGVILVIWLGPIWSLLVLPRNAAHEETSVMPIDERKLTMKEPIQIINEKEALVSSYQNSDMSLTPVPPSSDMNLYELLQTPSAWLMLWTTTILVGSGTYKTNNVCSRLRLLLSVCLTCNQTFDYLHSL